MYLSKDKLYSILSVVLIAALVVVIGIGSKGADGKWFQNSDVSTWFNSWGKTEVTSQTGNDQNADQNGNQQQQGTQQTNNGSNGSNVTNVDYEAGSFVMDDVTEGEGLSLYCAVIDDLTEVSLDGGSAPANYIMAYQLTVTATPATAVVPSLNWTVAFQNPSSTWATGKTVTDYVTINPTSAGAATATAYCLAPFGETIIISAASINSVLSCSATCNFIADFSDVTYELVNPLGWNVSFSTVGNVQYFTLCDFNSTFNMNSQTVSFVRSQAGGTVRVTSSNGANIGTLYDEVDSSTLSFEIVVAESFANALRNAGYTLDSNPVVADLPANCNYFDILDVFGTQFNDSSYDNRIGDLYNPFVNVCSSFSGVAFYIVMSGSTVYGKSFSIDRPYRIDSSSSVFVATSISTNQSTINFAYAVSAPVQSTPSNTYYDDPANFDFQNVGVSNCNSSLETIFDLCHGSYNIVRVNCKNGGDANCVTQPGYYVLNADRTAYIFYSSL